MLDSQAGFPFARVLINFSLESPLFRASLLRRLRLPLPGTLAVTMHTAIPVATLPPARAPAFCWRGGAAFSSVLLRVRSRQHVCLPCYCCRPVLPELPCSLREELKHAHTRTLNFAGPTAAVSPSLLRWSAQAAPCVRLLARCRAWSAPPPSRAGILYRFLRSGGLRSFPLLPRALSQPACCPFPSWADSPSQASIDSRVL